MISIYRFIYFLLKNGLQILKPFLSAKEKQWINLRSADDYLQFTPKGAIWFHASSGEIEYCKSVISEIRQLLPKSPIILSYSSPSAEKLLFNIKNQVDLIFPLPWDSPTQIKKALDHLQPQMVVFSRTDFWPELIFQLRNQKIKTAAISMFPRLHFLNRQIYKWLIQDFSLITTVDTQKSIELSQILKREVQSFADTRFDQVFNRLESPSRVHFLSPHDKKKIVFASTWPEDETVFFPCLQEILKLNFQIIICPHDITRATALTEQLKKFNVSRLSNMADTQNIPSEFEILLIDRVGYLADIYRSTHLTFVGGSFKHKIHSVMEPLCSKNVVFFGPYFQNNPEALDTEKISLTYKVRNAAEILDFVRSMGPDQLQKNTELSQIYAEKHRGSSRLVALALLEKLKPL
ncbi:MAG: hypothetical protein H7Z71_03020 [Moraxellaceae bacterium]|nr:hypothetical protein [Pseudobdellovibrionaceae bacterium]